MSGGACTAESVEGETNVPSGSHRVCRGERELETERTEKLGKLGGWIH